MWRPPANAAPSGYITSSNSDENSGSDIGSIGSKPADLMNDGNNREQVVDKKTILKKIVSVDKNEGIMLQWSLSGNNLRVEDVDIPELVMDETVSGMNTITLRPTSREEENLGTWGGVNEDVIIDLVEESDEEVIELELERAMEKVRTHTAYCPNCSSQITKFLLRTRKREDRVPSIADRSSDIDGIGSKPSDLMNDGDNSEQEVDKNDILEMNVYFDNNEGITLQWSLSGNSLRVEDLDIPKLVNDVIDNLGNVEDEIVSGLNTPTLKPTSREEEDIGTRGGVNENVRIEIVEESDVSDESDDEVIELEFERAVEKFHTHTTYCPNCSSQITKVILRRRKRADKVQSTADSHRRDKPVDLFGCLSCFRIFIPSGNGLNPFGIFGSKRKHESTGTVEEKHTSGNDQIKHEGGSNTEEENSLDNSIGALPVSSLHVPLLHGSLSSGHTIKDDNIGSSETVESHKTGDHPEITPPHASVPSGDVAIDIGDGIDGTSEGVTATTKPESELREEQSAKSQRRPGNHQVKHQGKDNNHKYGKTGFCASQITKITLRERKTGRQFSVYYR